MTFVFHQQLQLHRFQSASPTEAMTIKDGDNSMDDTISIRIAYGSDDRVNACGCYMVDISIRIAYGSDDFYRTFFNPVDIQFQSASPTEAMTGSFRDMDYLEFLFQSASPTEAMTGSAGDH